MKSASLPLLLLTCCTCTTLSAREEWLQAAIDERQDSLRFFEENRRKVGELILSLTDTPTAPTAGPAAEMPQAEEGETAVEADGGMLFDAAHARVVYLDNVRVTDSRLSMRCADRLFIQLPQALLDEGKHKASESIKRTPPAEEEVDTAPQEVTTEETAEPQQPIYIEAQTAMVNTVSNRALLLGTTTGEQSLLITQGESRIVLKAKGDTPAQVLADTNGDIYIIAGSMDVKWVDKAGKLSTLRNENGTLYYRAEDGKMVLTGATELHSPGGSISCTEELCLRLRTEKAPADADTGDIMPQFTGIRLAGVDGATAHGNVQLSRPATAPGEAATAITGESLSYDAQTGECYVRGQNTTIFQGENKLYTNGAVQLAANGDITLQGDEIKGNYTRPAADEGAPPIAGTFRTGGTVKFTAATATIELPEGITLQDEFCTLKAGGAVRIKLAQSAEMKAKLAAKQQDKRQNAALGNLNTAIANYDEPESVHATGGIHLHYVAKQGEQGLTITADDADINARTGEITLTSANTRKTLVQYNDFVLAAESTDTATSLQLDAQGDLTMVGDTLTATLPDDDAGKGQKLTTVHCTGRLTLTRATGRLEMGPGTRIEAPEARMSSNGPLFVTFRPGDEAKNKPLHPKFPHLVYNFTGLQSVDTEEGGTLQTPEAALRCTGRIHVVMKEQPASGKDRSAAADIEQAIVEGNVAIAGKDDKGKPVQAYGDKLTIDGASGVKTLSGSRVTLQSGNTAHTASGAGAAVTIDAQNNIRITGAKHTTSATNLRNQLEDNKKTKK